MRLTVRGTLRFVGVIVDQNVRHRSANTPVFTIRRDVAFCGGRKAAGSHITDNFGRGAPRDAFAFPSSLCGREKSQEEALPKHKKFPGGLTPEEWRALPRDRRYELVRRAM